MADHSRKLLQEAKLNGNVCYYCGIWFKKPHGFPVICADCAKWEKMRTGKVSHLISIIPVVGVEDLTPAERFKILGTGGENRIKIRKKSTKNG